MLQMSEKVGAFSADGVCLQITIKQKRLRETKIDTIVNN
jgi:hypothetical protein